MRRVLIWSDQHFHNWRQFASRINGVNSRLRVQVQVLEQIKELLVKYQVMYAVHGGDLFHTVGRVEVDVFNIVYESLQDFPVPLYLVDGNHDLVDRKTPIWFHRSFEKLIDGTRILSCPGVEAYEKDSEFQVDGIRLLGIGWPDDIERVKKVLQKSPVDLIVAHKEPRGSKYGGFIFKNGVEWEELERSCKFVLFGHIHEHQKLSDRTWVVGSPMQHNFGDVGDRGCVIVDFDEGRMWFEKLASPRFVTVQTLEPHMVTDRVNYYRVLAGNGVKSESDQVLMVHSGQEVQERLKGTTLLELIEEFAQFKGVSKESLEYAKTVYDRCHLEASSVPQKGWRLGSVKLQNFLSFKAVDYILKQGVTIVLGRSDTFQSNGAGKTALFDAIVWGLFGAVLRDVGVDDVVNRLVGKDCSVELELVNEESQRRLKVRRVRKYRDEGSDVTVTVQDSSGTSRIVQGPTQVQRLIEEELGCDRALFLNVGYFGQEVLRLLGSLSDSERQELVTKLLEVEGLEVLRAEVKKDKDISDKEIIEFDKGLSRLSGQIQLSRDEVSRLESELVRRKKMVEEEKAGLVVKINKCKELQGGLSFTLKNVREEKQALDTELYALQKEPMVLIQLKAEQRELSNFFSGIISQIRSYDRRIEILQSSQGKVGTRCEICGSMVDIVQVGSYVADLSAERDSLKVRLAVIEDEQLENKTKILTEEELVRKARAEKELSAKGLQSRITDLQAKEQKLVWELGSFEGELSKLGGVEELEQSLVGSRNRLVGFLNEEDLSKKTKVTIQIKLGYIDFWLEAFGGKQGIENLLLDRFCNRFNRYVGYYIATLSGGALQVLLSPQTQLRSGGTRDKISVRVGVKGSKGVEWVAYGSLSGGEKRRVDLAMLFALADVYRDRYRLSHRLLGLLILDEVFGFLDEDGEEAVVSVLNEWGKDTAVFVVSHTDTLKHHFDNVWTVVKEGGASRLECGEMGEVCTVGGTDGSRN